MYDVIILKKTNDPSTNHASRIQSITSVVLKQSETLSLLLFTYLFQKVPHILVEGFTMTAEDELGVASSNTESPIVDTEQSSEI